MVKMINHMPHFDTKVDFGKRFNDLGTIFKVSRLLLQVAVGQCGSFPGLIS